MHRTEMKRIIWAGLCLLMAGVTVCVAQDAAPAAELVSATSEKMTLSDVIRSARWPLYVLAFMSVLGVGFVVYFMIVLRLEQMRRRPCDASC